ncbi:hypothetical protein DFJ77DRAFT_542314 [Powellomyces hirtus]|nr:hypothetical protein DFJ77DRAFT_542314 [Powellomyces hirtus]
MEKKKPRKTRGLRTYRRQTAADEHHSTTASNQPNTSWKPTSVVGGSIGTSAVVFSKDSTLFFCLAGSRIKVQSATTGLVVRTLVVGEGSASFTTVQVHPEDAQLVYSSSTDGALRLWNHESGKLVKTWDIGESITHLRISPHEPNSAFLVTRCITSTNATQRALKHKLCRFDLGKAATKKTLLRSNEPLHNLEIAADGSFIAVNSDSMCALIKMESVEDMRRCYPEHRITSLALHPTGLYVAIGDLRGRITLWHCGSLFANENPTTSVLHWHPHQVNGLAFSADGEYLLSGGDETVLVVWQLTTRRKQFLPRLNAPIRNITVSPDQALYAITHQDNAVRMVVAATMVTKYLFAGPPPNDLVSDRSWKMLREPRNNNVVLFGVCGDIQFYDVSADVRLQQLEVTGATNSSNIRGANVLNMAVVTHVVFTADNSWMMTVDDRRESDNSSQESRVKFWKYNPDTSKYVVSTRIDRPHDGQITGAAMSAKLLTPLRAATTGADRVFRVWQLPSDSSTTEAAWHCQFSGSYRNMIPQDTSFASDDSLVAVSYQQVVTLWDSAGSLLQSVMTAPSVIRNVGFLGGSGYIISYSEQHIHVWNLLSGALWWSLRMDVQDLAIDSNSSHFAVISCEARPAQMDMSELSSERWTSKIYVFEADSPTPVAAFARPGRCTSVTFLTKSSGCELVVLNQDGELEVFSQQTRQSLVVAQQVETEAVQSAWSSLYSSTLARTKPTVESKRLAQKPTTLQVPSHLHPPPTRFFMATMAPLLTLRQSEADVAMDVEDVSEEQDHSEDGALVNQIKHEGILLDETVLSETFKRMLSVN